MANQSFSQMRLRNAGAILETVRLHAEISRADLARETDLSPATVSSIVDELIKSGFLSETGARSTSVGRRPIGLVFNPAAGYVAGISFGCKTMNLVLADLNGKSKVEHSTEMSSDTDALELTENCIKLARRACKTAGIGLQSVGAIGLAVPGPLKEEYSFAGGARRPEYYSSIKEALARKLGVSVKVDSLVNMAALAEGMIGAGQGADCLVYVRIGHAMRAATLVNHKLHTGKNGLAGEIGHLIMSHKTALCCCGKIGCVNAIAALPHFLERCRKAGLSVESDADFPELIAQDNQEFIAILNECACVIGFAIASMINTLAPDAVILSAPYVNCGAAFYDALTTSLSKYTQHDLLIQCKILQCQLKGSSEAYGAALSAMQSFPLLDHVATRL